MLCKCSIYNSCVINLLLFVRVTSTHTFPHKFKQLHKKEIGVLSDINTITRRYCLQTLEKQCGRITKIVPLPKET